MGTSGSKTKRVEIEPAKVTADGDADLKKKYAKLEAEYTKLQQLNVKLEAKLAAASTVAAKEKSTALTFLHLNDVYKILPRRKGREPAGGLARMATLLDGHAASDPIITMGGDFMSPSVMSTFTKGAHMIDAMNHIGIKVSTRRRTKESRTYAHSRQQVVSVTPWQPGHLQPDHLCDSVWCDADKSARVLDSCGAVPHALPVRHPR